MNNKKTKKKNIFYHFYKNKKNSLRSVWKQLFGKMTLSYTHHQIAYKNLPNTHMISNM